MINQINRADLLHSAKCSIQERTSGNEENYSIMINSFSEVKSVNDCSIKFGHFLFLFTQIADK